MYPAGRHPFWSADCPQRGPALPHTQDGTPHCVHCGETPAGYDAIQARLKAVADFPQHMFLPTITGLCNRCKQGQATGNHPASVGTPPIMEPGLAKRQYPGPDNGPGRGALPASWKSWARIELTPIDSEYR